MYNFKFEVKVYDYLSRHLGSKWASWAWAGEFSWQGINVYMSNGKSFWISLEMVEDNCHIPENMYSAGKTRVFKGWKLKK